jgi:hypothetical protein
MLVLGAWCFLLSANAQSLPLPPRPTNAPSGSEFAARVSSLELNDREREIFAQVMAGNIPNFLRKLCPVEVSNAADSRTNHATFYVTPDYLAIGSDENYLLMPISPNVGQRIADALSCSLPTRKMVNDIYAAAEVKLAPVPRTPGPAMTTIPVFSNHNAIVRAQRTDQLNAHPPGALVAGHQKDVVISAGLTSAPGKVAIYGWHKTDGVPIQPLYLKHAAFWVDYSQCTRLVQQNLTVDGATKTVAEVLADPVLADLLSDEGTIPNPRYPTNALPPIPKQAGGQGAATNPAAGSPSPSQGRGEAARLSTVIPPLSHFVQTTNFGERTASFTFSPDVKIHINAPAQSAFAPTRKVLLVFFALPNGSTTAQTIGKILKPGDDWHYDIQHIGAQTRFLREMLPDRTIVVAYLEAAMKSWPMWRKQHGDSSIPEIIAAVRKIFVGSDVEIALTSHSGGGSFIFGYLNAIEKLPDDTVRIAFLDSNYAYDISLGHDEKLAQWLKASNQHFLCVLAYNDAVALLDGKPFVSAAGGTWGRSHAMQHDLSEDFQFTNQTNADFQKFSALDGRLQFILKENPERKIFHTVQVERNGFIHCLVSGTANEAKGYEYFGDRAYSKMVVP